MAPQDNSQEWLRLTALRHKVDARAALATNEGTARIFRNLLDDIDCHLAVLAQCEALPPESKAV